VRRGTTGRTPRLHDTVGCSGWRVAGPCRLEPGEDARAWWATFTTELPARLLYLALQASLALFDRALATARRLSRSETHAALHSSWRVWAVCTGLAGWRSATRSPTLSSSAAQLASQASPSHSTPAKTLG
jgi:hypothetical protein